MRSWRRSSLASEDEALRACLLNADAVVEADGGVFVVAGSDAAPFFVQLRVEAWRPLICPVRSGIVCGIFNAQRSRLIRQLVG